MEIAAFGVVAPSLETTIAVGEQLYRPSVCLGTLAHPGPVHAVAIDCNVIATGCRDHSKGGSKVCTWELASRERSRTLDGHGCGGVNALRLRGALLVSGGMDALVKVWLLTDGGAELVAALAHDERVRGVALLTSGNVAAVGMQDAGVVVWRPTLEEDKQGQGF